MRYLALMSCLICMAAAGHLSDWLDKLRSGQGVNAAHTPPSLQQRQKFVLDVLLQVQRPPVNTQIIEMGKVLIETPDMYDVESDAALWEFIARCREHEVLGYSSVFSIVDEAHRQQYIGLYKFLVHARDWWTFQHNVCFARLHMNPVMFVNAFVWALRDRYDSQDIVVPALHEIMPHMFYDVDVIVAAASVDWHDLVTKSSSAKPGLLQVLGWHWTTPNAVLHVEKPKPVWRVSLLPNGPFGVVATDVEKPVHVDTEATIVVHVEPEDGVSHLVDDVGLNAFWQNVVIERLMQTYNKPLITSEDVNNLQREPVQVWDQYLVNEKVVGKELKSGTNNKRSKQVVEDDSKPASDDEWKVTLLKEDTDDLKHHGGHSPSRYDRAEEKHGWKPTHDDLLEQHIDWPSNYEKYEKMQNHEDDPQYQGIHGPSKYRHGWVPTHEDEIEQHVDWPSKYEKHDKTQNHDDDSQYHGAHGASKYQQQKKEHGWVPTHEDEIEQHVDWPSKYEKHDKTQNHDDDSQYHGAHGASKYQQQKKEHGWVPTHEDEIEQHVDWPSKYEKHEKTQNHDDDSQYHGAHGASKYQQQKKEHGWVPTHEDEIEQHVDWPSKYEKHDKTQNHDDDSQYHGAHGASKYQQQKKEHGWVPTHEDEIEQHVDWPSKYVNYEKTQNHDDDLEYHGAHGAYKYQPQKREHGWVPTHDDLMEQHVDWPSKIEKYGNTQNQDDDSQYHGVHAFSKYRQQKKEHGWVPTHEDEIEQHVDWPSKYEKHDKTQNHDDDSQYHGAHGASKYQQQKKEHGWVPTHEDEIEQHVDWPSKYEKHEKTENHDDDSQYHGPSKYRQVKQEHSWVPTHDDLIEQHVDWPSKYEKYETTQNHDDDSQYHGAYGPSKYEQVEQERMRATPLSVHWPSQQKQVETDSNKSPYHVVRLPSVSGEVVGEHDVHDDRVLYVRRFRAKKSIVQQNEDKQIQNERHFWQQQPAYESSHPQGNPENWPIHGTQNVHNSPNERIIDDRHFRNEQPAYESAHPQGNPENWPIHGTQNVHNSPNERIIDDRHFRNEQPAYESAHPQSNPENWPIHGTQNVHNSPNERIIDDRHFRNEQPAYESAHPQSNPENWPIHGTQNVHNSPNERIIDDRHFRNEQPAYESFHPQGNPENWPIHGTQNIHNAPNERIIDGDRLMPGTHDDAPRKPRGVDDDFEKDLFSTGHIMSMRSGEVFVHNLKQLMAYMNMEKIALKWENATGVWIEEGVPKPVQLMTRNGEVYDDMKLDSGMVKRAVEKVMVQVTKTIDSVLAEKHIPKDSMDVMDVIGDFLVNHVDSDGVNMWDNFYQKIVYDVYGYPEVTDNQAYGNALRHKASMMTAPTSMLREPVYWTIIEELLKVVEHYVGQLEPYQKEHLSYESVAVHDVDVDHFVTYTDVYDSDLLNAVDQQLLLSTVNNVEKLQKKVVARQQRLNHQPFVLSYDIELTAPSSESVVVRTFIGPRVDEEGHEVSITEQRHNFVLLDGFVQELQPGRNAFERSSHDISWTARDVSSLKEIYHQVVTGQPLKQLVSADCRFPHRLVLPRGARNGLPVQLLVVVTPVTAQDAPVHKWMNPHHLCGVGIAGIGLDHLPLGYPLDKASVMVPVSNILQKNVVITHGLNE